MDPEEQEFWDDIDHKRRHIDPRYVIKKPVVMIAPVETNPDLKRATSRIFLDDSEKDLRCAVEVRKRDREGMLGVMVFRVTSDPITGRLIFAGLSLFNEAEIGY